MLDCLLASLGTCLVLICINPANIVDSIIIPILNYTSQSKKNISASFFIFYRSHDQWLRLKKYWYR